MGWRRLSLLVVVLLWGAVALTISSTSSASVDIGPAITTLGEFNLIYGDRIAGIRVHIPRDVDLAKEGFDNPDISYHGRGRVVGFALVHESGSLKEAYQLVSTRWDFCGSPGCVGDWQTSFTFGTNWRGREGFRIPAGDYRLYLIADRAPVKVLLHLEGLSGHVSVGPTAEVVSQLRSPRAIAPTPSGHTFFGRGRPISTSTHGLIMDGHEGASGPGVRTHGSCHRRVEEGEEEGPEGTVPGPHCLAFADSGTNGIGFGALDSRWRWIFSGPLPVGDWRSSYWSTTISPTAASQFLTLWLSFEDPQLVDPD